MPIFIGILLFIIGTLAALTAAAMVISYLRKMSVYMSLKRLYRASFQIGAAGIVVLVSFLFYKVFLSGEFLNANAEEVQITDVATAQSEELKKQEEARKAEEEKKAEEARKAEEAEREKEAKTAKKVEESEEKKEAEKTESTQAQAQVAPVTQPVVKKSSLIPSFSVWTNVYKGHEYAYVEVENGVPYVYAPSTRGTFWNDLNNIRSGRESSNIVVMANAGLFYDDTNPRGVVIQNSKIISSEAVSKGLQTLVIDETGNVGYTDKTITDSSNASYTDALTGKTISGRKIVSAVTAFTPIVVNGEPATEYKSKVNGYRARTMFCVRKSNSYTIITNKGEGEGTGGWNFDDMATVALRRGCQFAFNLDGGGSTALAWRIATNLNFSTYATTERHNPTFIVFTSNNLAPAGK